MGTFGTPGILPLEDRYIVGEFIRSPTILGGFNGKVLDKCKQCKKIDGDQPIWEQTVHMHMHFQISVLLPGSGHPRVGLSRPVSDELPKAVRSDEYVRVCDASLRPLSSEPTRQQLWSYESESKTDERYTVMTVFFRVFFFSIFSVFFLFFNLFLIFLFPFLHGVIISIDRVCSETIQRLICYQTKYQIEQQTPTLSALLLRVQYHRRERDITKLLHVNASQLLSVVRHQVICRLQTRVQVDRIILGNAAEEIL